MASRRRRLFPDGLTSRDDIYMRATGQHSTEWQDRVMFNALHRLTSRGRSVFHIRQWQPEHPVYDVVTLASRFDGGYRVCMTDECGGIMIIDARKTYCQQCTAPLVRNPRAHKAAVFEVLWTHDSQTLLTGSGDRTCKIWDLNASSPDHHEVLSGHLGSVKAISQSTHDPNIFVTGGRDGRAIMWDLRVGSRCHAVHDVHHPFVVIPHANHPLVRGANTPARKRKRYSAPVAEQIKTVTGVAMLRGKDHIVTSGSDGKLHFWDTRMLRGGWYKGVKVLPFQTYDYSDIDHDILNNNNITTTTTAAGRGDHNHHGGRGGGSQHQHHSVLSPPPIRRDKAINNLDVSPDGSKLLVGVTNGVLFTHDVSISGYPRLPTRYRGHFTPSFYARARFSPDSRYILSASTNRSAYIWETRGDGWPVLRLDGHYGEVNDVSMSGGDQTYVATASDDNCVRVWSVASDGDVERQTGPCSCGWHCALVRRMGRAYRVGRCKEEYVEEEDEEVVVMEGSSGGESGGEGCRMEVVEEEEGTAEGGPGVVGSGGGSSGQQRRSSGGASSWRQSTLKDLWSGRVTAQHKEASSSTPSYDDGAEKQQ